MKETINNNELRYLELSPEETIIGFSAFKKHVYFSNQEDLERYKEMFYPTEKECREIVGEGKAWFNERGILVRDNIDIDD